MHDYSTTERYDRNARLIAYALVLLVALAFVLQRFGPAQPAPQPGYYWPEPTPIIVETQHIEIFSRNCIGYCPGHE